MGTINGQIGHLAVRKSRSQATVRDTNYSDEWSAALVPEAGGIDRVTLGTQASEENYSDGYGTLAAGRFLIEPKYLQDFSQRTGFRFDKSNIQIVIGTEVIQGKPGPPRVLAATSW
jgi:hypothetical protein